MKSGRNWGRKSVCRELLAAAAVLMSWDSALASEAAQNAQGGQASAEERPLQSDGGMSEEIIVTATKQIGVRAQDVPVAITAFSGDQIQNLQVRDFNNLSNVMPNVQLGNSSTSKASVNFSVRGLGTNSGIGSVEPQVGLFIDGVYIATQLGSLVDTFDLESVEVLRGPQGVLFGKNVTGGAVLVRTTTPGNAYHIDAQSSIESGLLYSGSAVVSGPITDTLSVKVAGYYSKDEGYFDDIGTGGKAGGGKTWIMRGAVRYRPISTLDLVARIEHGQFRSNQEMGIQNVPLFQRRELDIASSGLSFNRTEWTNATFEANLNVGLGDGVITNILGWRSVDYEDSQEIDAIKANLFQAFISERQRQWSNELRYAGTFGPVDLTTGLYYFRQKFNYGEARTLNAGPLLAGGGVLNQQTIGVFAAADWHLSDSFTVNLGARYTEERKRAKSAAISLGRCNYPTAMTSNYICNFDFSGENTWKAFVPKVGFQWKPSGDTQLYGLWTIGYRSGGYGFRRLVVNGGGGPYGQEKNNAFELGLKQRLANGAVRINAAVYRSILKDLQRDVLQPDPNVGLIVLTNNIADAVIQGVETEVVAQVAEGLTLNGFVGITNGRYTRVTGDLNNDGRVDSVDLNLKLIRVVPFSFGVGASYEHEVGTLGSLLARVNFGYKDRQAFLDNNLAFLTTHNMLDASIALSPNDRLTMTLYGRNLLNKRMTTVAAVVPAVFGGGLEVIAKGRVLGLSIRYKM